MWLEFFETQQLLQIIFVIFPIVKIVFVVEVEFLVLGLILPKDGVINCLIGFRFVLEALNDVILFLEQHVELFKFLVDGEQVGS